MYTFLKKKVNLNRKTIFFFGKKLAFSKKGEILSDKKKINNHIVIVVIPLNKILNANKQ